MTRIVTTTYRYKRPPRKRKAVALELPAIVRAGRKAEVRQNSAEPPPVSPAPPTNDDRKPAIVTARPGRRYAAVPDLPPEEVQRRGEAAGALWRVLVRRAAGKDGP